MTNLDLYRLIAAISEDHRSPGRSLREYLGALLVLLEKHQNEPGVKPVQFAKALSDAFEGKIAPIHYEPLPDEADVVTFQDVGRLIAQQVDDLKMMEEAGLFENEQRYFGVQSPAGRSWYNFDAATFIECGGSGCLDAGAGTELDLVSWAQLGDFLVCGAIYE